MEVTCDFVQDSAELRREELKSLGIRVPPSFNAKEVHRYYSELLHRVIRPHPRKVFMARGFTFAPEDEAALAEIFYRALEGRDLLPHQSSRTLKPRGHDDLLNDWGIHHLHLSTEADPANPPYVKRVNNLLFARVTHDCFYALAVLPHDDEGGRGNWSRKQFIQILHDNWPHTLNPLSKSESRPRVDESLTDDQIATLRRNHVMGLVTLPDGTSYAGIGGGFATAKNSVRAVRILDLQLEELREAERIAREDATRMADAIEASGRQRPTSLRLTLVEQTDEAFLISDVSAPDVRMRVPRGGEEPATS